MAKRETKIAEKTAVEQVQAFASATNFPKDINGVRALADALQRAGQDTGMRMAAIVEECLDSSPWCPTPFDLRGVALSMRDKLRNVKQVNLHTFWERQYGPQQPDWSRKLLGSLMDGCSPEAKARLRDQAIKDALFYTDGDGREMGDRKFWREAREYHERNNSARLQEIKAAGGWATERELQNAMEAE